MDPEAFFGMSLGLVAILALFVFMPWIILHYTSKFKANSRLTAEDEVMLEELYQLSRRLDDRMLTLERILADENSNWSPLGAERRPALTEERSELDSIESELKALRGRKSRSEERSGSRTSLTKQERA